MVYVQKNGTIIGNPEASDAHPHGTRSRSSTSDAGKGGKSPVKLSNLTKTTCKCCSKLIGTDNAARCSLCTEWVHSNKCSSLTKHEFDFLCNTPTTTLQFPCPKCKLEPPSTAKVVPTNPDYEARFDKIEQICDQFSQKHKEILDILNTKKEEKKEEKKDKSKQIGISVREALKDHDQRDEKKNNLILFNFPELEDDKEESEDIKNVIEVLAFVNGDRLTDNLDESNITRLGRTKPEVGSRPRGIKITFANADKKMAILRNAWKLANHPDFKKLGLSPDRTKQEREDNIKLMAELARRRAAGELNIKIARGQIVSSKTGTPAVAPEADKDAETETVNAGTD